MNTRFEYLYRDASNYKNWGEIIFAGEFDEALATRLRNSLYGGEWFIASQVRLPELFFIEYPIDDDDHCWHEFTSLTLTDSSPTDVHERKITGFILETERAASEGWHEFNPNDRPSRAFFAR